MSEIRGPTPFGRCGECVRVTSEGWRVFYRLPFIVPPPHTGGLRIGDEPPLDARVRALDAWLQPSYDKGP